VFIYKGLIQSEVGFRAMRFVFGGAGDEQIGGLLSAHENKSSSVSAIQIRHYRIINKGRLVSNLVKDAVGMGYPAEHKAGTGVIYLNRRRLMVLCRISEELVRFFLIAQRAQRSGYQEQYSRVEKGKCAIGVALM